MPVFGVAARQTTLQSVAELLGLIVIFLLVLAVCYGTTKFVAGKQIAQRRAGNFEVIETFALAQNKYLQLVRMGGKYVVISVTKDSVRRIAELSEEEVCRPPSKGEQSKNFHELFSKVLKHNREEEPVQKESEEEK